MLEEYAEEQTHSMFTDIHSLNHFSGRISCGASPLNGDRALNA